MERSAPADSKQDSVAISGAAKKLAESHGKIGQYRDQLRSIQEQNATRVAQVKQKVVQGAYNNPKVLEDVAATISRLPHFRSLANKSAQDTAQRRELLGSIAERVRSQSYDSSDILDKVAVKIINEFGN